MLSREENGKAERKNTNRCHRIPKAYYTALYKIRYTLNINLCTFDAASENIVVVVIITIIGGTTYLL